MRAWWSSRSSKPSPHTSVSGGRFDSYPLRHYFPVLSQNADSHGTTDRRTETYVAVVLRGGCASKLSRQALTQVLRKLPSLSDRNVLVGTATGTMPAFTA